MRGFYDDVNCEGDREYNVNTQIGLPEEEKLLQF